MASTGKCPLVSLISKITRFWAEVVVCLDRES
jgi:hypothetical protein